MPKKSDISKAVGLVGGKRAQKVVSAARKGASGAKKVYKSGQKGDIKGVVSGGRKLASAGVRGKKPAQKLAHGIGQKFKDLKFLD